MRIVAAFDKFRGTVSARQACAAVGAAAWEAGVDVDEVPLADGGDGFIEVLGGANRRTIVTGPLGEQVEAAWRLAGRTAVIEMALASGLLLTGGPERNRPIAATTAGVGELINHALDGDARRILVGLGGSATTDGGLGAVKAINQPHRLKRVELLVACDVRTRFVDAAPVFGPQKGATPAEIELLRRRLEALAVRYRDEYALDVTTIDGSGAAGGLAGGLAALGGRLLSGFEVVADEVDLYDRVPDADLIVTGEGHLDAESLRGKVVGGVCDLAAEHDVPVGVIVGDADPEIVDELAARDVPVISLVATYGDDAARSETCWCIGQATRDLLS